MRLLFIVAAISIGATVGTVMASRVDPPMAHDVVKVTPVSWTAMLEFKLHRFNQHWQYMLTKCEPAYRYDLHNTEVRYRVRCAKLSGYQGPMWVDIDPQRGEVLQIQEVK